MMQHQGLVAVWMIVALLAFPMAGVGSAKADGPSSTTIAEYPRYSTHLAPWQLDELGRFALAVVGAASTGARVDVAVYGHADFDAQGRDFEINVSQERANGAAASLATLIEEKADQIQLSSDQRKLINISLAMGLGTLRPIIASPTSEDGRKQNRRVEFVFTLTPAPVVAPGEVFQRCKSVLASAMPPGPIRRMTCVCDKLLQLSPRVKDGYYNYQSAKNSQVPGRAGFPKNATLDQWNAIMNLVVFHTAHAVLSVSNDATDVDFAAGLVRIDDTIGAGINDFKMQMSTDSAAGFFNRVIVASIRERMNDPSDIYACYAGYARNNADQ